ncbi:SHC-transforming protein 1 [Sitodiplosis mosellana]|uniref:SHC-transforming protein 1 n=1 Tax=Sitodiplosis mosellana TaxID=263140 RepID=UPI0024446847|nr:SHC-transforming protein 1 [Sitodiplosis mosellana]XP_055320276.1 SHC-transforming protein 1 [Sitodiplosis mosellana]XP_055320277.1 SHC-transforming protein 1 [Sitodiplosis mosellana]XP_055320278.1 SHC-transforming protein 1 [Sitodiplosis mosellana]XP_055320279.1 SHC-transforming protein 1 [Sitodiplosis mosellana]XP_055320280.1 SHC-transforming protein 1 [Sitodiplosis mosellana]XP_055320281.1 SHC-transforming protein 1 [Sitodiplosis mosellana]
MDGADGGCDGGKSFGSKPARGWSHADSIISNEGVTFNVRYIGCLEIKTSMKVLDFTLRSLVAKECINRVCEAAGLKTMKKRRCDKRIQQALSDTPNMSKAGANATLRVSSKFLSLVGLENNETIAKHDMPRISFASGGDSETLDFVAYVAKNVQDWRACYVLECGGGQASDLIAAIGQAFELRYNEFFNKSNAEFASRDTENLNIEKDYYNDLPGKLPPELLDPVEDISSQHAQSLRKLTIQKPRERLSSNLIDLNSPPPDPNYVNDKSFDVNSNTTPPAITRDVFDMQPFSLSAEVQRSQLLTEQWFHASISRQAAEALLKHDGDFLVRESQGKSGQYVLTGLQAQTPKHLLLIDPEGTVRTKDRIFDSISHLINYHWTNVLPIISEQSALVLRNPVIRDYSVPS